MYGRGHALKLAGVEGPVDLTIVARGHGVVTVVKAGNTELSENSPHVVKAP